MEVLETRCLMSGWHPSIERDDALRLPIRGPAVTSPIASHDHDRPGIRQRLTREVNKAGSASGGADGRLEYGVGGWGSDATTLPGLPSRPRARYVIVPETKAPHQTLATAQQLPTFPYVGVVGTTASGDPIDLYRVDLPAGAGSLSFGLLADQPAATVPVQLQVFDGSGRLLGEWSSGGQGTSSLNAELSSLPAGSTLYFGVTAGNSSGPGGPSGSVDYQLWISSQPAPSGATTAPGAATTASSSAALPLFASPLPASTGLGVVPPRGASPAGPTSPAAPADGGGGLPVSVGSPAVRAARPSAGLLSDGDPAPAVSSDFNASVNKNWDEASLPGPTSRPANEVGPTASSRRENGPDDALVVIHGPGGFPLLGAVAIGHRRSNPVTDVGDFATPAAMEESGTEESDTEVAAQGPLANPDIPATEDAVPAQAPTLRDRPWSGFPISIFSGLGAATVFTLNAVLSQPIAGFDYLTSRLDTSDRPRPSRSQRLRKSASEPDESSPSDGPPL
jgi:hypothetical protein